MAFSTSNQLLGDDVTYKVNPAIKKYALTDFGFHKTNANNFAFERGLDVNDLYNGIKLKIVFKGDLKAFKMSTVTANGLNKVNIFKNDNSDQLMNQLHFIMDSLVDKKVLIKTV
jgi:hypothetical protein